MEQVIRATNLRAVHQPYENWMFDRACDLRVVRAKLTFFFLFFLFCFVSFLTVLFSFFFAFHFF